MTLRLVFIKTARSFSSAKMFGHTREFYSTADFFEPYLLTVLRVVFCFVIAICWKLETISLTVTMYFQRIQADTSLRSVSS